ncbi:MAG: PIN domain nuclease [Chloroflexi bacterium]|nr:PIN domain nuclease [Chloroflexota bacterium]
MNQSNQPVPTLSNEFILRLIGGIVTAIVFGIFGSPLADYVQQRSMPFVILLGLMGFLTGIILTPYFTTRPLRHIRNSLVHMAPERLIAVLLGVLTGLLAGGLFSIPLSFLPSPFREIMPLASVIVLSYLSSVIFMLRQNDLRSFVNAISPSPSQQAKSQVNLPDEDYVLLDTSVIIDGRITDVSKTGFMRSTLLIPSFILRELQHIADSADHLRRNRGRRGLDVLGILQNESPIPVRITDMDTPNARDADSKLVVLAKELRCPIMTNDYNLNRVAELQGVTVLNINDLANAVKAAYLPGEALHVRVIQEGREVGQGIGYLEDGTMVVVEDGQNRLNQQVNVVVTKVLQTTAGRMVFARFPTSGEIDTRRPTRER